MEFRWTQGILLFVTFLGCVIGEEPTYITQAPVDLKVVVGESALFHCKATNDRTLPVTITWLHNGETIDFSPGSRFAQSADNSLTITHVHIPDNGTYICLAKTDVDEATAEGHLIVKERTQITTLPIDVTVPVGKSTVFHCKATSDRTLPVIITWLHNGETIDFSPGSRFAQSANNSLTITHVQLLDNGTYICLAKTDVDEATAEGHLIVAERLRVRTEPQDLVVSVSSPVSFRCHVTSKFPLPVTVTWQHNGENIDLSPESRFKQTSGNTLTFGQANTLDFGTYTCLAKTAVDEVIDDSQLTVADVPDAPLIRKLTCSSAEAHVEWESAGDNNSPIKYYTVMYQTSSQPDMWRNTGDHISAPNKEIVYRMSEIWTNYTFIVSATNDVGFSPQSSPIGTCETQADVPHDNPGGVEGRGRGDNSLVISWTAMRRDQHHGPGFKYRVSWKRDVPGESWNTVDISNWEMTKYVVSNQPKYQKYKIRVEAFNDLGMANVAPGEVIGYSNEGVPTQSPANFIVLEVIDGWHALVRWDPVNPETVRGKRLGYKIQVSTNTDNISEWQETVVRNGETMATVGRLTPNAKNYARVLVYNGEHDGPPSKTVVINTPEGVPGLVHNFDAYAMGSSALYVTWEAPQQANGVLTSYKISWVSSKDLMSVPEQEVTIVDPECTHLKISGLNPGTEYRLGITASTMVGEGDNFFIYTSTKANNTAPPGTPRFEWYKEPTFNGAARIRVVWKPDLDGNLGSHFFVKYREKGEGTGKVHKTPPQLSDVTTVVGGLTPSKVYDFKVVAVDGEHQTESDSQEVDTVPIDIRPRLVSRFPGLRLEDPVRELSLTCAAIGTPPLQFMWTIGGYPIPNDRRFVTDQMLTLDGTEVSHLNITNMTESDGGEFSCTVRNHITQATHRARIDVYGQPFIRVMPKITVIAGSAITVKCPVTGFPIDAIVWRRDGERLLGNGHRVVYRDGTLVIDRAQHETDSGTYTCEAQSMQSASATRNVEIQVLESRVRDEDGTETRSANTSHSERV